MLGFFCFENWGTRHRIFRDALRASFFIRSKLHAHSKWPVARSCYRNSMTASATKILADVRMSKTQLAS